EAKKVRLRVSLKVRGRKEYKQYRFMIRLIVPVGQENKSLLACVTQMLPGIRPGEARKILEKGDIKRNGSRTRQDETLHAGDVLEVYVPKALQPYPRPEIVYQDDHLIVVNKNPGISVVDDREDGKPTVQQLISFALADEGIDPIACHRLDHNTGGLVLFAKNEQYFELFSEAIAKRQICKYYKVIVAGVPSKSADELTGYLKKDADNALVQIAKLPFKGALSVKTRYSLTKTNGSLSLLEVELITGRTHQIRAHLASIGLPVLGDDKYGNRDINKKYGARYQALWATKLVFRTGEGLLGYLDGKVIEADKINFPDVDL
ncbi:MAG: RluA family pseudouridine synthase, partial [Eubacteriales bacterium]